MYLLLVPEAFLYCASKKQKGSGGFHDQSIDQLNDVTAVSGVNLRVYILRFFNVLLFFCVALCIPSSTHYQMDFNAVTVTFARKRRSNFSLLLRKRVEFQKLLVKLYNWKKKGSFYRRGL